MVANSISFEMHEVAREADREVLQSKLLTENNQLGEMPSQCTLDRDLKRYPYTRKIGIVVEVLALLRGLLGRFEIMLVDFDEHRTARDGLACRLQAGVCISSVTLSFKPHDSIAYRYRG